MIGYSDSSKDAGRLAASWALFRTQERLVQLCKDSNVQLTLFHGRGGSVSRGGGTGGKGTYNAILARPKGAVDGRLRTTEQVRGLLVHVCARVCEGVQGCARVCKGVHVCVQGCRGCAYVCKGVPGCVCVARG
jgi:hypothetical protein